MLKKYNAFLSINLLIIITLAFCNAASAGNPARVLILPFTIHSEKDLSFLQKGVEDMLSTRLSKEGKVVPFSRAETQQAIKDMPEPINIHSAVALGERLQADYAVFGSLTVFGDSISTDARFIDVSTKKQVVIFNQSGESKGDLISHIDAFADLIHEKVFGHKPELPQASLPKEAVIPDSRRHPEAIWARDGMISADVSYDAREAAPKTSFPLWESRKFKIQIKGMSVGDVDGDNKNEAVFISNNKIFVYRNVKGKLVKVAEIGAKGNNNFIGVDVADINKNGKAEIFITNLPNTANSLESFVLEWNGTEFTKIVDHAKWYFRVINVPGRDGKVLLGQRKGLKEIFDISGVYELKWDNNQYDVAKWLTLPKSINIYGFTYGDVLSNGQDMIVAFTENNRLCILDTNGNEKWQSSVHFGGGTVSLEFPSGGDQDEEDRICLSQRIFLADIDKDKKNEIIVVKNTETTDRSLFRSKVYKNGHIECLDLDDSGFTLKWKTKEISGQISDYIIADLNNDGHDELVFSIVTKTASLLRKAKSLIVSQEIKL